jgi:glycosyltransferase involved in cell wall biosynthesis
LPRWDGIARMLSEIIPPLSSKYDITVIAPDFGDYEDPKIKLIKIPLKKLKIGDFSVSKFALRKIRAEVKNTDVVFTQTIGPIGGLAILFAWRHKQPLVSYIHSLEWELVPKATGTPVFKTILYYLMKRLTRKLYNKCDVLIVPSSGIADILSWEKILTKKKVAHLGVELSKFTPDRAVKLREQLGIKPNDIVIGQHGRISREKDLITLLRAFIRLQTRYSNIKLLIVGDGIESIKKKLRERKDVILPGAQDNVVPYLQAMDIYVLSSLTETTSLTTLEAMSCELPVIATPVGFVKDYIQEGVNGLFFEKKDAAELVTKLSALIENEKYRRELGQNARKSIRERFKWEVTAEKISEAIDELMNPKK